MAFSTLEPFGGEAEYLGHAITAATVANRGRQKNEKAHKIDEFIPKFKEKAQSVEQMVQIAQMYTIANGGKDLRDG